jgi:hypothetical protein
MRTLIAFCLSLAVTACSSQLKIPDSKLGDETATLIIDGSSLKGHYVPLLIDPSFQISIKKYPNCIEGVLDFSFGDSLEFGYLEEENHTQSITIPSGARLFVHTAIGNDSFMAGAAYGAVVCDEYISFVPEQNGTYLLKLNYESYWSSHCPNENQFVELDGNNQVDVKSYISHEEDWAGWNKIIKCHKE